MDTAIWMYPQPIFSQVVLVVGIKIAGRNISNLRYAEDTTLMAESEELKSLLMKVKSESEVTQSSDPQ